MKCGRDFKTIKKKNSKPVDYKLMEMFMYKMNWAKKEVNRHLSFLL